MNTIRKTDLINKVTNHTGIRKVDVLVTIEQQHKEIIETVKEGDKVAIRGFGTFEAVSEDNGKTFRPVFIPSRKFSEQVTTTLDDDAA